MANVTNFQISPFKVEISENCKKMIKELIWYSPSQRPSIKDVLMSDYVREMCAKFKWDLAKLTKIKKMASFESKDSDMNNSLLDNSFNQSHLLDTTLNSQSNKQVLHNEISLKTKMMKTKEVSHHYEPLSQETNLQSKVAESEHITNPCLMKKQKTISENMPEIDLDILESGFTVESKSFTIFLLQSQPT
jgi:hypothetical protein